MELQNNNLLQIIKLVFGNLTIQKYPSKHGTQPCSQSNAKMAKNRKCNKNEIV